MSAHAHDHAPTDYGRAFGIGIVLNLGFVAVEGGYGIVANSMALVADAGHNLSDVLGLAIAWGGARMTRLSPSPRFSYGLKKASILSALINALLLLVAVGAIAAEAIRRLIHPAATQGHTVIAVALAGIVVNGITAWLFASGRHGDINLRGAFQHMAADAAVSAAVVVSGFVILYTGQLWVDPVTGLAVAAVILWGSWGLLKESVGMTLAGVPDGIALDEVEAELGQLPGVVAVHDLHVWPLSTTETALTAHLFAPQVTSADELLEAARTILHDRFGIMHCTLQVERHDLDHSHC
ncbi:MAG: cation diffusion facilitator family transporter [Sphingomicrobium sp.]